MSFFTGTQVELLYAMPSAGAAATGTTATTQLLAQNSTIAPGLPYYLPANFFNQQSGSGPGKSLLLKGGGWWTTGSTSVTLTLSFYADTTAGTTAGGTLLCATGAFTTAISITNGAWDFEILVTCSALATGAHTNLNAVGHLNIGTGNNAAVATFSSASNGTNPCGTVMIGAPNAGALITSTSSYAIDPFASWSTTTGGPTITMTNFLIFGLN
jgi:hypothetical protein